MIASSSSSDMEEEEEEEDQRPSWMRREPVNNADAQVAISCLPESLSDREIHRFMSPFGFIKQLDRLSSAYCLIEFFVDLDARRAILHKVLTIDGVDVLISERPGHVWGEKKAQAAKLCASTLLAMKNIAFRATNEEITRILTQFGPVKRLVHFFGQSNGWVEFAKPQHAQVALDNPIRLSLMLHDKAIELERTTKMLDMPSEDEMREDTSGFVLYISDFPHNTSDEELYLVLVKFGPLRRLTRFSATPVHYAFAEFVKAADAQKAAAAGRVLVRGRTVRVGENRDDTRVERVECSSCRQLLSKDDFGFSVKVWRSERRNGFVCRYCREQHQFQVSRHEARHERQDWREDADDLKQDDSACVACMVVFATSQDFAVHMSSEEHVRVVLQIRAGKSAEEWRGGQREESCRVCGENDENVEDGMCSSCLRMMEEQDKILQ